MAPLPSTSGRNSQKVSPRQTRSVAAVTVAVQAGLIPNLNGFPGDLPLPNVAALR